MTSIERIQCLRDSLRKNLHGKEVAIESIIVCLLAGGHVLIEDVPGVGKTTLAYMLAKSVECEFTRIQFTSDILPSDIIGVSVYQQQEEKFQFIPGPVFSQFVLADEINRASPKSQSALLEVMERGAVSVDGSTHRVNSPFMVIATQNPVDLESTFPLPQSQLDRFLMRLSIGYPDDKSELHLLNSGSLHYDDFESSAVIHPEDILKLQEEAKSVFVEESLVEYIHSFVKKTRNHPKIEVGVSPRGGLAFKRVLQASAFAAGRDFVAPEDIALYAKPCLAHRIRLIESYTGAYDWSGAASIIEEILNGLALPHKRD